MTAYKEGDPTTLNRLYGRSKGKPLRERQQRLIDQLLPQIAVPLLPDDPAVPIDLQVVFNRCYDTGSSPRRVRYNEDTPVPLLTEQQAKWTAGLLGQR